MAKLSGVTASFEPSLGGKLLYLPVAIVKPGFSGVGSGMVNFSLKLSYTAAPQGPKSLEAATLKVWFPGTGLAVNTYPATGTLKDGGTLSFFLDDLTRAGAPDGKGTEARERGRIWISTKPAPAAARIEVSFDGFEAVTFDWPLQAHANPTPEGSYAFPFKAEELANNEYIFTGAEHYPDQSQHWGYDFLGYVWNGSKFVFNTGPENTDYSIFGRQIYASADGVVLKADDSWIDHPRAPLRAIIRTAVERGPAGVVSVAAADPDRIFTAVTDEQGHLLLLSFAPGNDSRSLNFLGKSAPGLPFVVDALSTTALSTSQVVVTGAANGTAFVSLYSISADGAAINCNSTVMLEETVSIRIDRYSSTQFLMARQPADGNLEVSLWEVGVDLPKNASKLVSAVGASNLFDLAVIDNRRAVTALQTASGKLKVIVWNIGLDDKNKVTTLTRGKDRDVSDNVNQISVSATRDDGRILVGTRNGDGNLAAYYFQIDADTGSVDLLNSEVGGAISRLALVRFKRGQTAVAVIGATGEAKLIGYEIRKDYDSGVWDMLRTADFTDPGGVVTAIDIARIVPTDGKNDIETCAVAVRTASGKLKLIIWRAPQANTVHVLYGNECVLYAHLQYGSVPAEVKAGATVKKGDRLGRAGFSGSAGSPQLHIHCEKVDIDARSLSPAQLTAIKNGSYVISGSPRPMLFNGVSALADSELGHKGWANEPFVNVEDKGFYFQNAAIYPKPKPS